MYHSETTPTFRRAFSSAAMLLAIAACGDSEPSMSIEEARTAVVVSAGGAELKGDMIEKWVTAAAAKPEDGAANLLVGTWIDEALFAAAAADNAAPPFDSGPAADTVIQMDASSGTIGRFLASRRARVGAPADAQVDSLEETSDVRVMQQILLKSPPGTRPTQELFRRGQQLRQRAAKGEDFTTLVMEASEDSAGKVNGGFLPAVDRAEMVDELEKQLWPLAPGGLAVVASPVGVHVVRRATVAESRAGLKEWLHLHMMQNDENAFRDSVFAAHDIKIVENVNERLRAALMEPVSDITGDPVVSWKEGSVDSRGLQFQLRSLNPGNRMQLYAASDSDRVTFIRDLGKRRILENLAAPNAGVSDEARSILMPQYQAALAATRAARAAYTQSTPAGTATAIVDAAIAGTMRHQPLPGALGAVLRSRYPVTVNQAALRAIVQDAARRWQPPVDSTGQQQPQQPQR